MADQVCLATIECGGKRAGEEVLFLHPLLVDLVGHFEIGPYLPW